MYVCIIYIIYVYDVNRSLPENWLYGIDGDVQVSFAPIVGHFAPYSRSLLTLAVWYRRGCAGSGGYKQMYKKSAHSRSLLPLYYVSFDTGLVCR
jgi:hypothetical protein